MNDPENPKNHFIPDGTPMVRQDIEIREDLMRYVEMRAKEEGVSAETYLSIVIVEAMKRLKDEEKRDE